MKNTKLFKLIDLRILQALAMAVIIALFLYLLYFFYGEYRAYNAVKSLEKKGSVEVAGIQPPESFILDPKPEETLKYSLFSFREKPVPGKSGAGTGHRGGNPAPVKKAANYRVLGVVKKDKMYLVVRMNSDQKIRLFGEGDKLDDHRIVKHVTFGKVVIEGRGGGEQVHKVFQLEPRTIFQRTAPKKGFPKTNHPQKTSRKQTKADQTKATGKK